MSGGRIRTLLPWTGIAAAALGWSLAHQLGSDTVFDDCRVGGGFVLLVCLLGLVIAGLGGLYSWSLWRREESESRRFLGLVGALLAALAAFAILLQGASGLILAPCAA